MRFSEEERKIPLTQKHIEDGILSVKWFEISACIALLAMFLPLAILSWANFITRAFVQKIFDAEAVAILICAVFFLFPIIVGVGWFIIRLKRFLTVRKSAYTVVEDQIDYLTLEEEVRYKGSGKYRRRVYVLVDILHFKEHGEYRIDNPCGHAGGDKFYLVISEDGEKIYNIYSQKTYYYRH